MSTNQSCPATIPVVVCVNGNGILPLRTFVYFSPHSGLSISREFARRYWYLPARAYVDRYSSLWLRHFDSVAFIGRRRLPIR